jgi:hypothetical protein
MPSKSCALCGVAVAAIGIGTPALAGMMKAKVEYNNGIQQKTGSQPADGMQVSYQVTLNGGDLDGCTVDIVEALYGRDDGVWGIFDIAGYVRCGNRGEFSYTSLGSWDGNGFHGAGSITEGSGTGEFHGISGRVAQLGGVGSDAGNGTFDIFYELVFDTTQG